MWRMLGAVLLASGCGWFGFQASASLGVRVKALRAMAQGLAQLEQELELDCPPLPQLMERLAVGSRGPAKQLFQMCGQVLQQLDQEEFAQGWRRLVSGLEEVGEQAKMCLYPLGDTLGRCGWEEQKRVVECVRKELLELAGQAEEERRRQGKVYQALGLSGGAFLVILLL